MVQEEQSRQRRDEFGCATPSGRVVELRHPGCVAAPASLEDLRRKACRRRHGYFNFASGFGSGRDEFGCATPSGRVVELRRHFATSFGSGRDEFGCAARHRF